MATVQRRAACSSKRPTRRKRLASTRPVTGDPGRRRPDREGKIVQTATTRHLACRRKARAMRPSAGRKRRPGRGILVHYDHNAPFTIIVLPKGCR
jgi:hypothetical protein